MVRTDRWFTVNRRNAWRFEERRCMNCGCGFEMGNSAFRHRSSASRTRWYCKTCYEDLFNGIKTRSLGEKMKKCKRCGTEISVWYYRAHIITHDSDIDMDVLDGPYCLHCIVDMPAPQSSVTKVREDA